ncbi:hypothetical protein L7F22_023094 [Adiantum nelumboides]|nr:hypothetical protein [Adiantum nelumboides]
MFRKRFAVSKEPETAFRVTMAHKHTDPLTYTTKIEWDIFVSDFKEGFFSPEYPTALEDEFADLKQKALNKLTIKNKFPMPRIEYNFERSDGAKFLTKIDVKSGYNQAAICFFSVVYGYGYGKVPDRNVGRMVGLYTIGTTMYTSVLFVVNLQIAMVIQYWTWIHHVLIWGELVVWFFFLLVFGALPTKYSGALQRLFISITATSSSFYRVTLLTTILALLPSFTLHCFFRAFCPSDSQIVQEQEKLNRDLGSGSRFAIKQELELMPNHNDMSNRPSPTEGLTSARDSFEAQSEPLWSKSTRNTKQKDCHKTSSSIENGSNGIIELDGSSSVHRTGSDLQRTVVN